MGESLYKVQRVSTTRDREEERRRYMTASLWGMEGCTMRSINWAVTALVGLLACFDVLAAQDLPYSVEPGQRARLRIATSDVWHSGVVERLNGDSLVLRVEANGQIPISAATRLQLYQGQKGHAGTGALIGGGSLAAVGMVYGLFVGAGVLEKPKGSVCVGCGFATAALFGAGGVLIGAIVGSVIRSDRWEDVTRRRPPVMVYLGPDQAVGVVATIQLRE